MNLIFRLLLLLLLFPVLMTKAFADSKTSPQDSLYEKRIRLYNKAKNVSNSDSVLMLYEKIEEMIPRDNLKLLGRHNKKLGDRLLFFGKNKDALRFFADGIEFAFKAGDSIAYYAGLSGMGEAYGELGLTDSASIFHKKALAYFTDSKYDSVAAKSKYRKQDSLFMLNYSYINRAYAFILKSAKLYKKGHERYQKHLISIEKLGTPYDIAGAYLNAANFEKAVDSMGKAVSYFKKAEKIALDSNYAGMLPFIYYNLAAGLESEYRFSEAKVYARKTMDYTKGSGEVSRKMHYLGLKLYAICEFAEGKPGQALQKFYQVEEYLKNNPQNTRHFSETYIFIALCLSRDTNFDNADSVIAAVNKFRNILEEENHRLYSERIAQFEVEMETQKAISEAETNRLLAETSKSRNYILIVGIFILTVISTALLKLYRDRKRAHNEQVKLSAMKDKFISLLAHDIRGPLATTLSSVEVMRDFRDRMSHEAQTDLLSEIEKSGRNLLNMLEDILKWMKASTNSIQINKSELNLFDAIRRTLNVMIPEYDNKDVNLQINIDKDATVFADKGILNTVVRNFLQNAVKFSNPGSEVILAAEEIEGNLMRISVQDYGIGMSKEELDMLFGDVVISRKGTAGEFGTGFGLQMCREFMKAHGSRLQIESEKGKGTKAYFDLNIKP